MKNIVLYLKIELRQFKAKNSGSRLLACMGHGRALNCVLLNDIVFFIRSLIELIILHLLISWS